MSLTNTSDRNSAKDLSRKQFLFLASGFIFLMFFVGGIGITGSYEEIQLSWPLQLLLLSPMFFTIVPAFAIVNDFRCPKCRQHFFHQHWLWTDNVLSRVCYACGINIDGKNPEATREQNHKGRIKHIGWYLLIPVILVLTALIYL